MKAQDWKVKVSLSELEVRQGEIMGEDLIATFIFHMSRRQMKMFSAVDQKLVKIEIEEIC